MATGTHIESLRVTLWQREALFHMSFITCTILGQYARSGITVLAEYSPSYIRSGSIIWANFVACVVMGALQELKSLKFIADPPVKHLFIVFTMGFCGAFSSYPTMILEIFEQSTSLVPYDIGHGIRLRNKAYGIMEFLAVLLPQLLGSVAAYLFGREMIKTIVSPYTIIAPQRENENKSKVEGVSKASIITALWFIQITLALLSIPLLTVIIALTCIYSDNSRGQWTLPAVFAIFGKYLRWQLSTSLNTMFKTFPLGTFLANQLAVILLAVLQLVLRGKKGVHETLPIIHAANSCHVVNALVEGFVGALGALSTFVHEGYNLCFKDMLVYFGTTISASYCLMVVILGSYSWTRGLTPPVC